MSITISEQEVTRIQRAAEQAADYLVFPHLDDVDAFIVVGKKGQRYTVTPEGCSCRDAVERKLRCKHFWRVRSHVENLIRAADLKARRANAARNLSADFPEGN